MLLPYFLLRRHSGLVSLTPIRDAEEYIIAHRKGVGIMYLAEENRKTGWETVQVSIYIVQWDFNPVGCAKLTISPNGRVSLSMYEHSPLRKLLQWEYMSIVTVNSYWMDGDVITANVSFEVI